MMGGRRVGDSECGGGRRVGGRDSKCGGGRRECGNVSVVVVGPGFGNRSKMDMATCFRLRMTFFRLEIECFMGKPIVSIRK